MKKVLLSVLTTLIALLFPATMSAQLYVIDSATQDSVNVNTITITSDDSETLGLPVVCKLPKGETVKVERLLKGQTAYGVIKIEGKEYGIIGPGVLGSWFSVTRILKEPSIFSATHARTSIIRQPANFSSHLSPTGSSQSSLLLRWRLPSSG